MYATWPFFRSTIELLEMVLSKTSKSIAAYYESLLVPEDLQVCVYGVRLCPWVRVSLCLWGSVTVCVWCIVYGVVSVGPCKSESIRQCQSESVGQCQSVSRMQCQSVSVYGAI